jgi:hypothetical protein
MSEVRLVIRDASRAISGTPHGAFGDAVVAALSAEPETIEELDTAVERFQARSDGRKFFGWFSRAVNDEPHDAGLVIIDLPARLIAYESTYSAVAHEGYVRYHDGRSATRHDLRFHLPDDWKITCQVESWESLAGERRRERAANPPLDARDIVYGRPLLEFIASRCFTAPPPAPAAAVESTASPAAEVSENGAEGESQMAFDNLPCRDEGEYKIVHDIHVDWLMTPRDDLRGQTPREVLVARRKFIGWDMQDRSDGWSRIGKPAPCLDIRSHAYRFAGFGTHELVTYYELVRHLLWKCRDRLRPSAERAARTASREFLTVGDFLATEIPALEAAREEWLDAPDPEYHGRTPRSIIHNERIRLPEAGSGHDAMVDHDCPLCQMMADMPGEYFWGLDGSGMDDDFAFSIWCPTREEWDAEQRRYEEFNRKFKEEEAERKRLGVDEAPGGGYASPDYVWERSFVSSSGHDFPAMRIFAIGSNLAELIVDLKEPSENRPLIDQLNRDFANLREVSQSAETGDALVEPVINRFCETLDAVAAARTDLQEKCSDLQARLRRFVEPPSEDDPEAGPFLDSYPYPEDDVPF